MFSLLLLAVSLVHSCIGGVYPGTVSTSEAHGPLARLALDSMTRGGQLQYYAPGAVAATVPFAQLRYGAPAPVVAPIPVAPPARFAAPVDVVHHVPTVADVPVTKYVTQPGYVQKLVDVTKTKVATAKLQVRRPAIQKQFYDIEERTVVRPVGSAVLELDEPVSKNYVSPVTVVPSGQHTVARYQRPLAYYPVNAYPFLSSYPFQAPVQSYPFFIQQTQGITQLPQGPPQNIPQRPQIPQQPQFPAQQPQIPQQPQFPAQQPQIPQQPQFPAQQPQIPQQPQFPAQQPQQPQFPAQQPQFPQSPQPPQQLPSAPQPIGPPNSQESSEFDFSDTVVVDNPELGRSGARDEQQQDNSSQNTEDANERRTGTENTARPETQFDTSSGQQILNEFQTRQLLRQFFSQNDLVPNQRIQQIPQPSQQPQPKTTSNIESSNSLEDNKSRSQESSQATQESSTESSTTSFRSQNLQSEPRAFSAEGQIASTRASSPEEAQSNQQKLIELLTGRGEVSEVELSRSGVRISSVGDAGVVRGRVLSVTPAPRTAEGEERVSTRRVVVSRPVQTLEEVDVQQPFAHVERVAVHEPALLKTAHTHLTRVPAAVPVLRTLAPVHYY
ncbi:eukaryotic translation initiation factor 4 gamma-like [Macrosteles quadrilineatus]|uniref:eukaryotic translation initiation factor 4 gamma-like n=1 Tax=Macrosteles quadrilineatus TaxID=74068 RepID=UPI0023E31930|nr:eukaryotic translation initiation factor 4 gamma-like [Macrosteles quadrilineatus]